MKYEKGEKRVAEVKALFFRLLPRNILEELDSEDDSLELPVPKKKKRRTAKKAPLGCERIESFAKNTELGKLRLAGSIKSAPITKSLYTKINSTVKVTKSIKKKAKKSSKKKKKIKKQPTLAAFGFFKPKPRPGEN